MKPFCGNPFYFMLLYAWRNKGLFCLIILSMLAGVATGKLAPYYFSKLVNLFGFDTDFSAIKSQFLLYFLLLITCTILKDVMNFLTSYLTDVRFQPKVYQQMNLDLFLYLSHHSVNFFANNMAGALANKSNLLATSASGFYISAIYYLSLVCEMIFTFILFLTVNMQFAFFFLITVCFSVFIFFKISKTSVNLRQQMMEARNLLAGNMIDAFQNHFFVRLFNGYRHEEKRAYHFLKKEADVTNKSVAIEAIFGDGQKLYFSLFYLCSLFYGLCLWQKNCIDNAQLVLIFLLMKDVKGAVSVIIQRAIIFSGVIQEMRTNLAVFSIPHDIKDKPNAQQLYIKKGKIEFKNITFGYDAQRPVFKNFSFVIEPKQKIGIVGMSGCGKSTFINLIERFFDLQSGKILIDGQNIADVTQQSLHQSISYIAQTTTLLELSIADNIAYARPNVSKKQIIQAAKKAYAHDFIMRLPDKYNTLIKGDNQLSGGQNQRLSLARAILKDAPILILDEATSALDSQSEAYIQKSFEILTKNKTVIAIAHRLSTLKHMDKIIVLDKGQIAEEGTFDELINQNGLFNKFWQLQQAKDNNYE